jgi:membrane fusion protein, copper/silver efflux system
MKRALLVIAIAAVAVLAAGGYGLYRLGMKRGMGEVHATSRTASDPPAGIAEGEDATRRHLQSGLKAGDVDPGNGRKILYYHDPMAPANKFDRPGKSPYMDMMLVPVYAGVDGDDATVTVSSGIEQNLGLRTTQVVEATVAARVSAVGSVAFNERDQVIVQARATGFVERLYVRATLDPVRKGQPLADLYVPDWVAAQQEFLAVRNMQGVDLATLLDAARERMQQAGMTDEQIRLVESTGRVQPRLTLTAPIGGVVVELMAREGMTVMAGATLFRINGLATVWANAEVPESQAALVRPGAKVRAKSDAVPGVTFDGRVQAILPEVNPATHTLKARMELANAGGRLVPGMFVTMQFTDLRAEKTLMVPTDAVIQTGQRSLVMLAEDSGRFRPAEVETGIESGGQTEIKRGLQAGQKVVVSSQFLIDSEASLRGLEARLNESPGGPNQAAAAPHHHGEGKVSAIGPDAITLSHGPIASIKWGPMTMAFKLPPQGLPPGISVGERVDFEFTMGADGLPRLTRIRPAAQAPMTAQEASATGSQR